MEDTELIAHYDRGKERDRLAQGAGLLEFTRTTEIVLRNLPSPPATVADIGGGPGRYSLWLAGLGYQVEHRDLMPLHVQQLRDEAGGINAVHTEVGNALDLDLADASVDALLLLGPLYHLRQRAERVRALAEARRVVRSRTWSASRGQRSCWRISPSEWTTRPSAPSSSTRLAPSSACPNSSASARTS